MFGNGIEIFHVFFFFPFKFIKFQCFQLSSTQKEYRDVILSPYAPIAYNRKFAYFYPKFNNTGRSIVISKVPWEEPLKESANLALSSDTKIRYEKVFVHDND